MISFQRSWEGQTADPVAIQRAYYAATADRYDAMHVANETEQDFALAVMLGFIPFLGIQSVLDIGSGTGRALRKLAAAGLSRIVGVEPSPDLRRAGHAAGVPADMLIDGDAQRLAFADGEFDLVCEFGALHHIPDPRAAVQEMLRVARRAIFISDSNNFGQGGWVARAAKQALDFACIWPHANWIKTRGRRYSVSEGDGVFYSYSVFTDYKTIAKACRSVHVINTIPAGINPYRTARHVALLGVK